MYTLVLPTIKVLRLPEREALLVTYVCINMAALGEPVVPRSNRTIVSIATKICAMDNELTGRKLQVQDVLRSHRTLYKFAYSISHQFSILV